MWNKARAELAKMRRMPFGEAVDYFWTYYKIHVLFLAVCVFFLVLIFQAFSGAGQETALSAMLVNTGIPQSAADEAGRAYFAYAGLDAEKQRVSLDAGVNGAGGTSREDVAGLQKLLVSIAAGEVDVILSPPETADYLLKGGAISDLQAVLPEDVLALYRDQLRYADAAALSAWIEANRAGEADMEALLLSDDPAGMAQPVPVGVEVTDECRRVFGRPDAQGTLVLCVAVTTPRHDACGRFLEFLKEGGA